MKIPTPQELLDLFKKTDPSIFMAMIPQAGIVSYASRLHNFGFVVGINAETGNLSAIVGNANIYVPNEQSEYLSLENLLQWFNDRFSEWKSIEVDGRIVGRREAELMSVEQQETDIPEDLDSSVVAMIEKRENTIVDVM